MVARTEHPAAQATLGRHGFRSTPILAAGGLDAIPPELRVLVSGPYEGV